MSKGYKILLAGLWAVLITVLVVFGLNSAKSNDIKPRSEVEDIVAVTGSSAQVSGSAVSGTVEEDSSTSAGDPSAREADDKAASSSVDSGDASKKKPVQTHSNGAKPSTGKTAGKGKKDSSPGGRSGKDVQKPTPKPQKTYSFTIECKNIINRPDLWRDGLGEILPKNGVFYSGKRKYRKGMTVYDELKNICEEEHIFLDSRFTPLYDTYYVSGIGNLYEFDCGSESGWKYSVNGDIPGFGASKYKIKEGDKVVFFYDYKI